MVAAGVPDIEHVGGGSSFQNQKEALAAAEGSCAALTASDGVSRSLLSLLRKAAGQISCGKTCVLLGLWPLPQCFFGCIHAPGLLCCASRAPAPEESLVNRLVPDHPSEQSKRVLAGRHVDDGEHLAPSSCPVCCGDVCFQALPSDGAVRHDGYHSNFSFSFV